MKTAVFSFAICIAVSCGFAEDKAGSILPRGDWEKHGFAVTARDELRTLLREQVEQKRVPGGALIMVHQGEVVFAEGFGWANLEAKRPFRITDPVRIASITKPIVATAIVALAAEGRFSLDEPVSTWLAEFRGVKLLSGAPASRAPTIRELLSHTGGAPVDESTQGRPWLREWTKDPKITLDDVVKRLSQTGLAWEPRARFGYSGSGFDIAVRAVEAATGQPFEQQVARCVLVPLDMTSTTFRPSAEVRAAMPAGYHLTARGFVASSRVLRERGATGYVTYGGSIVTTPEDLAKFLLLHLRDGEWQGRQLVPVDAVRAMRRKPEWSKTGYGLGWSLGRVGKDGNRLTIGHTGSSGTACKVDFQHQTVWVLFTQMPVPKDAALEPHFRNLVRDKLDEIVARLK
ncbi:MAG: beta-lactamase family protein [Verrucomicrobia bacterium]|nr:beta-lactamase family protein [Verrucomicrobiota bacterium]